MVMVLSPRAGQHRVNGGETVNYEVLVSAKNFTVNAAKDSVTVYCSGTNSDADPDRYPGYNVRCDYSGMQSSGTAGCPLFLPFFLCPFSSAVFLAQFKFPVEGIQFFLFLVGIVADMIEAKGLHGWTNNNGAPHLQTLKDVRMCTRATAVRSSQPP